VPRTTFARKLDHLFRVVHPATGEHSARYVAGKIAEMGEVTISATYIWQLRTGVKDNPTKKHMEALAAFFGVDPSYFMDDAVTTRVNEQLDMIVALRDVGVKNLALRAVGLSEASVRAICKIVENVRALEGLDPVAGLATDAADGPVNGPAGSADR
jgi:transcriptional regulator with XRE-family HTH domain